MGGCSAKPVNMGSRRAKINFTKLYNLKWKLIAEHDLQENQPALEDPTTAGKVHPNNHKSVENIY